MAVNLHRKIGSVIQRREEVTQMIRSVKILGILTVVAIMLSGTAALVYAVKLHTIFGEVKKVDTAANTLTVVRTVAKKEKESLFHLEPQASITRNGQKVTLGELKEGDHIVVRYALEKGMLMARSISLGSTQVVKHGQSSKP